MKYAQDNTRYKDLHKKTDNSRIADKTKSSNYMTYKRKQKESG